MPEQGVVKYLIKLRFETEGIVEKPDIVGAIFGQTEGLFGPEMNLNELQKTWKVGRIEIRTETRNGRTEGDVLIPMSTDISTAALIAAAIENVEKVGPCKASFRLDVIDDVRATKKKAITERAKNIVKQWASKTTSESDELLKSVGTSALPAGIINFGKEGLPAGPGVYSSDSIIVVEGRADVNNLLRTGFDNVVAIEGTKIPYSIIKLAKDKELTAFLDGDRSGDLILKELNQVTTITKVIRAPRGREVEDLTPVEITDLINNNKSSQSSQSSQSSPSSPPKKNNLTDYPKDLVDKIKEIHPNLDRTLEAIVLSDDFLEVSKVSVSELIQSLDKEDGGKYLIFDGIITQRLLDACSNASISHIVGHRTGEIVSNTNEVTLITFKELDLE